MQTELRYLQISDIPGAMRLKDAAGWNQAEADWARLLELQPDGCFALDDSGELAATATALVYGEHLAWIGMVLTGPRFRGRGFARTLMHRAMTFAEASGVARVGLDATDMGISLYRSFGFEEEGVVERWGLPAGAPEVEPARETSIAPWTPDPDLDVRAFGTDRTRLLASLATDESAAIQGSGYAMGRAGSKAAYFGPCVAKSARAAGQLVHWFLARHAGEPVYWDILRENLQAARLAEEHGFQPLRRLTRMKHILRPDVQVAAPDTSLVFAIAGLELG